MNVSWSCTTLQTIGHIRQYLNILFTMCLCRHIIVATAAWRACSVLHDKRFGQHANQYELFFAIMKRIILMPIVVSFYKWLLLTIETGLKSQKQNRYIVYNIVIVGFIETTFLNKYLI